MVDGLHDPAVRGALVTPAASEFIQIINVGRHWVCLSNIGVRVFDSLYSDIHQNQQTYRSAANNTECVHTFMECFNTHQKQRD